MMLSPFNPVGKPPSVIIAFEKYNPFKIQRMFFLASFIGYQKATFLSLAICAVFRLAPQQKSPIVAIVFGKYNPITIQVWRIYLAGFEGILESKIFGTGAKDPTSFLKDCAERRRLFLGHEARKHQNKEP